MRIEVVYFSILRDLAGCERESLELPPEPPPTVGSALGALLERHPRLAHWEDRILLALNCRYARTQDPLADGDELALMPPVQGG